jgi:hypothetical protein
MYLNDGPAAHDVAGDAVTDVTELTPVVNSTNILRAASEPMFFCQKLQIQTVIKEKLCKTLLCKKGAYEMLVKFKPCRRFNSPRTKL